MHRQLHDAESPFIGHFNSFAWMAALNLSILNTHNFHLTQVAQFWSEQVAASGTSDVSCKSLFRIFVIGAPQAEQAICSQA